MTVGSFGHYISVVMLILILMAFTAKYALDDDASWQKVSAQGLHVKIQTGLSQMYWQWQQQGRANQIEYKPENVKRAFIIDMSNEGVPLVEKNEQGCKTFLSWFIEEKVLNNQLDVTTTYIQETTIDLPTGAKLQREPIYSCHFDYANKILRYDLSTGHFTFTD